MAQDDDLQFFDINGERINLKARWEYGAHIPHVIAITSPHQHIHEQISFIGGMNAAHGSELANDTSQVLLLQVGSHIPHLVRDVGAGGDFEVFIQEGVTFSTAGTPLTIFNKYRPSAVTSTCALSHTPTGVAGGTALPVKFLPGGSGGTSTGSVDGGYDREMPLKANTDYVFTITNRSGNVQMASDVLEWYEPTNPDKA